MPVRKRSLGITLMVGGVVIALIGVVGWIRSGDLDPAARSSTTTTTTATTTTDQATTSSSTSSTTTTVPTTTTSTTVPTTTTTTIDAGPAIESFIDLFTDAITRENTNFLLARLHPAVLDLFGPEACRAFITEEILQLEQYRLIGEVMGPIPQVVADVRVDMYRAPAAFVFQGQEFTSEAGFALVDGEVRWFTQCGR